jgi:hypothetical protein
VAVAVTPADPVARSAGVAEAAGDAVAGGVADDVPDGLIDASGVFFTLAPVVAHGVAPDVLLADAEAVAVGVGVAVAAGDVLGLTLGDGEGDAVADWLALAVGVGLMVGVAVLFGVAVLDGVAVAVLTALAGTHEAAGEGWRLAVVLAVALGGAAP